VAAVGRTFHTLQSSSQLVQLPNHDFVYEKQVSIFIRPQWSIGTLSITHIEDLSSLVLDNQYSEILKINDKIKPIWVLLVDAVLDKNPRHLKNIESYCKIFKKFDLDYLSSKYNPVERGMATLSGKLASIVLPIDHFGKHFDSQGRVVDDELVTKNLHYAEKKKLNQRNFDEEEEQDLNESANTFVLWFWIKKHYGHYINPVHLLQYSERFKVPSYDAHCPSINQTMYSRLCCSICYKYFSTLLYVAKHKHFQHSSNHKKARKEPEILESVAKFVVISNSATIEDLDLSLLQQNESYLDEYRECFSDME
ncbi:33670_t:CDS:2, partial [Gigaspora margarita]